MTQKPGETALMQFTAATGHQWELPEEEKVRSRQVAQHELYQWGTSGKNKPPATSFEIINKEK